MEFESLVKKCRKIEKERTDTIIPVNDLVADDEFKINGKKLEKSAHANLRTLLNIPPSYYQRMFIDGDLWAYNVNTWLTSFPTHAGVMIRETSQGIYAFMSPSYRRVNDSDLLITIRSLVQDNGFQIQRHEINQVEMSCTFKSPVFNFDVSVGDIVEGGFHFYNSQDGSSRLGMNTYFNRCMCENGMVFPTWMAGLSKIHLTKPHPVGEMLPPDLLDDRTCDRIHQSFKDILVEMPLLVSKMQTANKRRTTRGVDEYREILGKIGFGKQIIEEIARGVDDASYWGVLNSVTHLAKEAPNRLEMEQRATQILELL